MYKRRNSSVILFTLIILGFAAGLIFLVYDSIQTRLPVQQEQPVISPIPVSPVPISTAVPIATATLPTSFGAIEDASLFIPSAGILTPIIRVYLDSTSWNVSELGLNVGHLQGTNWIDDGGGNIVLSGHVEMRDGRTGVFAELGNLQIRDRVVLRQGDIEWIYAVTEIRNVAPDDLTPLYPTTSDRLTLITCDDYDFLSNSYQERTIVVAERIR